MTHDLTLLNGDCREMLKTLPDASVHTCVTSPPYFQLRDYNVNGQIGLEETPEAFVAELVSVFSEVRRVLRDDGVIWVNLGDSYAGGGGHCPTAPSSVTSKSGKYGDALKSGGVRPQGIIKQKDLIGIPWRVAFALQADGWYLRQDIIWSKSNPMPESVTDRCTKAHEYIFLLSKSPRYYYDTEAMRENAEKGAAGSEFHTGKTGIHQLDRASTKPRAAGNKSHKYVDAYNESETEEHRTKAGLMKVAEVPWETRNKRSVWTVATAPYSEAHFATFPPDLIRPCVRAGAPPGGVVLDPFGGSGTTGQVALEEGRKAVLIELNPAYCELIRRRCSVTPGLGI